eukprot:6921788-Prymnesium_polylepis.1
MSHESVIQTSHWAWLRRAAGEPNPEEGPCRPSLALVPPSPARLGGTGASLVEGARNRLRRRDTSV